MKWKKIGAYMTDRKASFSFTIGSIAFGVYCFIKPISLTLGIYRPLHIVLGLLSGKYMGLLFIVLGVLKLIGLILDVNALKLPLYFALLFLWTVLTICFLVALFNGDPNYLWILTGMIASLSTSIISQGNTFYRSDAGG